MPKNIFFPPHIRDFECEKISFKNTQEILPTSFEKYFSVNFPYTIQPNSEFSFTVELNKIPSEILITNAFRFGEDLENNTTFDFYNLKMGKFTISTFQDNCVYFTTDDSKRTKIYYYTPSGESGNYIESVSSGQDILKYVIDSGAGHIFHKDAINKKISLKNYTVEDDILKITFFNEETTPIVLNKFTTLEPKNTVSNNDFNSTDFLKSCLIPIGNKVFITGDSFATKESSSWVFDSVYFITNTSGNTLDPKTIIAKSENIDTASLFGSAQESQPLVNVFTKGVSACLNSSNDGYFVAFMVSHSIDDKMRFILYDSQTDQWTLKNDSSYLNNNTTGIYTSHLSDLDTAYIGRKPMDMVYSPTSGNVHVMATVFSNTYEPNIIYSDTNMETWTTIFDASNLPSPISAIGTEATQIPKLLTSKMINEDEMFSSFCSYTSTPRNQTQFLFHTTDRGQNWTDVHSSNPEYSLSRNVSNFISDDGQRIYSMVYYSGSLYPDGNEFKILFNYSVDGGTTWTYPSGSWKIVTSVNFISSTNADSFIYSFTKGNNIINQRHSNLCGIYHDNTTNEIMVITAEIGLDSQTRFNIFISRDNGITWESQYPGLDNSFTPSTIGNKYNVVPFSTPGFSSNFLPPELVSSNDSFFTLISLDTKLLIEEHKEVSNTHDYVLEYSIGNNARINSSYMYISTINDSANILKIKGFYL